MHVATTRRQHKDKVYETVLLRRSFREDGKVKNETLANLSHLPAEVVELVRQALAGKAHVLAGEGFEIERSLPHGHVAAVCAMASRLGLAALLGPACPERDLAMAFIVARVAKPASKLATGRWWADTTLGTDFGTAQASTDDIYAAMDWLVGRQEPIEAALARRHLGPGAMVLYDLSSSWVEGSRCPLAARGYSRDGKAAKAQIEYGLMTDVEGRPLAVEVFAGNTADPMAFVATLGKVRERFKLSQVVMVGDRGMITSARIDAMRDLAGLGWVSALRAPAIKKLVADGTLQLGLFDQMDLAEIAHPDFPGERLVACKNPLLAAERARKRNELLDATEALLEPVRLAVDAGRLVGADRIGLHAGRVVNRHKMAKHFELAITDDHLGWVRKTAQISAEAALDGIYVVRTSVGPERLAPRRRGRLQEPGQGRTRLPLAQSHRLGLAAHLPPPRRPCARPRAHLHAGRLPGLAPAPSVGTAHLHRREPAGAHQPRRCCPALRGGPGQGLPPHPPRRRDRPRPGHTSQPPGHPHPQHHRVRRWCTHRQARRPHPATAPNLRAHRRRYSCPAPLDVDRTTPRGTN